MNNFIALFRGINIGGHNQLPMPDLVRILERLGCERIETYIQSGNAVFWTRKSATKTLAEAISARIQESHGFKPKVLLLRVAELEEAIKNSPFKSRDGRALHVFFLESVPKGPDLAGLMAIKAASEQFQLRKRVFYLYAPDGVGRSRLVPRIEKSLGVPVTGRNWNTDSRLMAMVKQS